jgi:hypothetical protein
VDAAVSVSIADKHLTVRRKSHIRREVKRSRWLLKSAIVCVDNASVTRYTWASESHQPFTISRALVDTVTLIIGKVQYVVRVDMNAVWPSKLTFPPASHVTPIRIKHHDRMLPSIENKYPLL